MTTLTVGTYRNIETKRPGLAARTITKLVEAWKDTKRYDQRSPQRWSYIKQNLTDPRVGPEIARILR